MIMALICGLLELLPIVAHVKLQMYIPSELEPQRPWNIH
jgi:hypothetical protein